MPRAVRLCPRILRHLTDTTLERNLYVHPNPVVRDIFWQRLERLAQGLAHHGPRTPRCIIDLGGGSGAFLPLLTALYPPNSLTIVDLNPNDAVAIAKNLHLPVNILKKDILTYTPPTPADLLVAADVLEHFQHVPIGALLRCLCPQGLLAVSLPTENTLYRWGRIVLKKQKPQDHYHNAAQVLCQLHAHGFRTLWQSYAPRYLGCAIPLFKLAILQRPSQKA